MKKKVVRMFIAMSVAFIISFGGCLGADVHQTDDTTVDSTVIGMFKQDDYLKVDGTEIKCKYGRGDTVMLRGTNAGGYLIMEQWMTAVRHGGRGNYDHKTATQQFNRRFGEEQTAEIWQYYRDNYWTEQDFAACADMGMTAIRLPFSYMNVDFGGNYDFAQLDEFIEGAAEYGIYTILDMHGAYGSQNGQDHSGEYIENDDDVDFYSNEEKMSKTAELWRAVAEHYIDNPAVAAFDLLNEPGEHGAETGQKHWRFFDRLYDAVRSVDEDRVVIFEACWKADNLPPPEEYGWKNCVYSYHLYASTGEGYGADIQVPQFVELIDGAVESDYGVPCYLGEFNCYNDEGAWEYVTDLLNKSDWHWTSWTYKVNFTGGWGICNTHAQAVDPATDSIDSIYAKWADINSAAEGADWYMFPSGKTLYELMKEACGYNTDD